MKAPKLRPRLIASVLGIALLALLVGLALRPRPIEVEQAVVARGPLVVTVEEDGLARVRDRYTVSAPVSGTLARLEVHAGDRVAAGAALARVLPMAPALLDARTRAEAAARVSAAGAGEAAAREAVGRAELAAEEATQALARARSMAEAGGLTKVELDRAIYQERMAQGELRSARFGAAVAKNELAMAKAVLGGGAASKEEFPVLAPSDGVVLQVLRESEGAIAAGTPVLEFGDPAALEVVVDVLTADASRVEVGDRATITRWGGEDLEATVRLVEPSAFTRLSSLGVEEQRVNVALGLDSPPERWARLGDRWRVEARIAVDEVADALYVPQSAVFRQGEGWAVYAIVDGVARLRPVEIGLKNGMEVEIRGGLAEGDRVVVFPGDRVAEGARVTARQ